MAVPNMNFSYLKNGSWHSFTNKVQSAVDGIKIQTGANSSYYLQYRTRNQGKTDFYSFVKSNGNDFAGVAGRPVQLLQIQAYKNDGTKLTSGIVVMYRVSVSGRWLPWVSNAEPAWMESVHKKYNLGGALDTDSYYAGNAGQNIDGVEIQVYEEGSIGDFTGGEVAPTLSTMTGSLSSWTGFEKSTFGSQFDGIKIQTSPSKDYYLEYRTKNAGNADYYSAVKSTGTAYNDYAGYPGKPIQLLSILAYKNDGTRLRSGVIVMYRVAVKGRWLPWVSNADPQWMRDAKNKYGLDGVLDTQSTYAGNEGESINGVEIRVFEDDSSDPGLEDFTGSERMTVLQHMSGSLSNWTGFSKKVSGVNIDGIKIFTSVSDSYYLGYQSKNQGNSSYYPEVKSTGTAYNDYAGYPGKPMQLLKISAYAKDGTRLRSGVVVMYRVSIKGRWLPWVSNAGLDWMRSVQSQYNLGGTLDAESGYAGNDGENIDGVEIHVYEGVRNDHPVGDLPEEEYAASLSYMVDSLSNWKSFQQSVQASRIDGVKIQTDKSKPYYLSYKSKNAGNRDYYPEVKSTGTAYNDYAGYPGKAMQLLRISVYSNSGVKLKTGVVVMYRVHVDNRWLPWVSNAEPAWMRKVHSKYKLDGKLDTVSYYAGNEGQNINGVEVRIFEEENSTITPVGKYKIIDAPFLTQLDDYPTGCESVTTVMALKHAGVNLSVDTFIDQYLDKKLSGVPFNPMLHFGGDPRRSSGYGCYAPVIKKACDKILSNETHYAKVVSGESLSSLCSKYIDQNIPVILWATQHDMAPPYNGNSWTYNGKTIQWISPMHCLLLVGYDDKHYIFNDPLKRSARTYYSKASVERAYEGLHKQAIVLLNCVEELERIDRSMLMKTCYYSRKNDNPFFHISSDFNDYNMLACLQLLFMYYWDKHDYEKTDMLFEEMLLLRKLQPSYRTIYSDFLDEHGELELGYQYYAPGRKTTQLTIYNATYFSTDTIRDMRQADDWLIFISSLIPSIGPFLAPLMAALRAQEQDGSIGLGKEIVKEGLSAVGGAVFDGILKALKAPKYVQKALNTLFNFTSTAYDTATEAHVTYVRDGITLQDGDSYVDLSVNYDLGVETHYFRFYFRNGYPIVTSLEQSVVRSDYDSMSAPAARDSVRSYTKEGYVTSEIHMPRGAHWPLKD